MAIRYLFTVCLALSVSAGLVRAQSLVVDLSGKLISCKDDQPVMQAIVEVTVTPPPEQAKLEQNRFRFQKTVPNASNVKQVGVEITPPAQYEPLAISLRRTSFEPKAIRRSLSGCLIAKGQSTHDVDLDWARHFLDDGKFEKALSFFQYAFARFTNRDRFRAYVAKVVFNYARALQNACIHRGYDTCGEARERFVWLEERCKRSPDDCEAVDVTLDLIRRALQDLDKYEQDERTRVVLLQWEGIEKAFAQGGVHFKFAADRLEGILEGYDDTAPVWVANGKPEDVLRRDAGLALYNYTVYLEQNPGHPDVEKRAELLERSKKNLEGAIKLGDRSPSTIQGLGLVRAEMSKPHGIM